MRESKSAFSSFQRVFFVHRFVSSCAVDPCTLQSRRAVKGYVITMQPSIAISGNAPLRTCTLKSCVSRNIRVYKRCKTKRPLISFSTTFYHPVRDSSVDSWSRPVFFMFNLCVISVIMNRYCNWSTCN